MRTDELDFHLPSDLIAQEPAPERSLARMLRYDRATRNISHNRVSDLPDLLRPGDLLVFNDTRVLPARIALRKPTGGLVQGLYLDGEGTRWRLLLKNLGPIDPAAPLTFDAEPDATLRVLAKRGDDGYDAECSHAATDLLPRVGRMPLPPYIKRGRTNDLRDAEDRERYQTVLASNAARSVAVPTAALHFDYALLQRLADNGVATTTLTLTVGLGTFKPVVADDLDDHPMHRERWWIPPAAADAVNAAKADGRRVIAIGTTVCRTLEAQPHGGLMPGEGETDLLIRPPYRFHHVDALLTNFHLPRSTLIALVDALIGTEERRRAYAEAITNRYRFFSYGDCMLVE